MFVLSQKLKNLKVELHSWNKSVFGDVHRNVEQAQALFDHIQAEGDVSGYNDLLLDQEKNAQVDLLKALQYQAEF